MRRSRTSAEPFTGGGAKSRAAQLRDLMPESAPGGNPVRIFDAVRFVSYYLQALGWISIGMTIASSVLGDGVGVDLDLSFVFLFWAASAVKRRSETARRWVVGVGSVQ